jgi:GT2 family glycosyltransferase
MPPVPPVSLLIPCRNGAKTLPRLLASARAQTVPFAHVAVFDDASDDGTADVARALGASVLSTALRVGVSEARNRLAAECATEWFHFHDADDCLDPGYVEIAGALAATDRHDVVVCDVDWYDPASRALTQSKRYSRWAFETDAVAANLRDIVGGIHGLYRKSAFLGQGGFDRTLALYEDWELHVRMAARGARFTCTECVLATAFVTPGSASLQRFEDNIRACLSLVRRWADELQPRYRPDVARAAERYAVHLLYTGREADAREAIAIARAAGGNPPTTDSRVLRWLSSILPVTIGLRLQRAVRAYVRLDPGEK